MTEKPVCIIPARGGSKRIPHKNIVEFNGKPLIAWPIETALRSNLFSSVIVSTDDQEIADIAMSHGASVPFMRKAELADDHTGTAEVLVDALESLSPCETACCLYPTAPMVRPDDLASAFSLLVSKNADSVISVCEFDFPPLRGFEVSDGDRITFKWPEHALARSQDLPDMLHDAGAFYLFRTAAFKRAKTLVMNNTLAYRIERSRAQDIDTPDDLDIARRMHQAMLKADSRLKHHD